MIAWLWMVWSIVMAVQGLWMLWEAIEKNSQQARSPVLVDLGRTPWSIWRVFGELWMTVSCVVMCWVFFKAGTFWDGLLISVFLVCLLSSSWIPATQRRCLLDLGMRVTTRMLWTKGAQFIPWSVVQHYRWDGTTLIVNPGWNQVSCLIPEESVDEVNTIVMQKCPHEAVAAVISAKAI